MTRRFAVLFLMLALTGCVDAGQTPATMEVAVLRSEPPGLTDRVVVRELERFQGESFVSVSPDGQTVLTCTHGGFREPSPSFVSEDAGSVWRQIAFPPDVGVGGDCETEIMPDGTWVFVLSTVAGSTVVSTVDRGKTFVHSKLASIPTNGLADRPWIDSLGDVLIISYMPLSVEPGFIGVMRSTDRGATWSGPQHVSEWDGSRISVMHGHLQVSSDQESAWIPLIKYQQPSGLIVGNEVTRDATLGYAVTRDGGLTWQEHVVVGPLSTYKTIPTMALAGERFLYLAYPVPGDNGVDMLVQLSRDQGTSWEEPVTIVEGMPASDINWIDGAIDGSATLFMSGAGPWFGFPDSDGHLVAVRLDANVSGVVRHVQDVGSGAAEFYTVDHDASGRAFFSYSDGFVFERQDFGQLLFRREM